jgi:hypothetical protein
MALPIAGAWAAQNANAQQYAGALKWGTGASPVLGVYGEGPPLRTTGRPDSPDNPTDPLSDIPESFEAENLYGYCIEDIETLTYSGMPPPVGTLTTELRARNSGGLPDWGVTAADPAQTEFRNTPELDPRLWSAAIVQSFPTETVSEGWRNKTTGQINDAEVSDPSQYERQTSMQQVNPPAGRNNDHAVARRTDDPRYNILTRLTGMKLKPWSQGERNQDMFPFQQDTIVRPFWYRTAGTDDPAKLAPNAMVVTDPLQRNVPADPDLGPSVQDFATDNYGYTQEDIGYG